MRLGSRTVLAGCWIVGTAMVLVVAQAPLQAQVVLERMSDGSVVITNHKRRTGNSVRRRGVGVSPGVQVLEPSRRFQLPSATGEIQRWVKTHAARANLEEKLVLSLIAAESDFDANARSKKGAIGLMQLMPATAKELGVDDPWDPESNIRGGTRYLRQMLDRFDQNLEFALAAYNAGPGAVERNGGVPPYRETQNYVRRVLSRYHGRSVELTRTSLARTSYRPIRVRRDENGHLVILTP